MPGMRMVDSSIAYHSTRCSGEETSGKAVENRLACCRALTRRVGLDLLAVSMSPRLTDEWAVSFHEDKEGREMPCVNCMRATCEESWKLLYGKTSVCGCSGEKCQSQAY